MKLKNIFILPFLLSGNLLADISVNFPSEQQNIRNRYESFFKENKETNIEQIYISLFFNIHSMIYNEKIDENFIKKYIALKTNIINSFFNNKELFNKLSKKKKINFLLHIYILNNKSLYSLKKININFKEEINLNNLELLIKNENKKLKAILKSSKCNDKHLKKIIDNL